MGDLLTGSTTHKDNISMLTPQQQQQMAGFMQNLGPQFQSAMSQLMQPMDAQQQQDVFQKSYVEPAQQALQQQLIPGIKESFGGMNASSSSALNQALAQAATDVSTNIGTQYGNFLQNQNQNQLQALSMYAPLLSQQTFSPLIQEKQGIMGPLISAGGAVGAGLAMSSRLVKENIRDYDKGMDLLENMDVKQYDYIEEVGGKKDKVGLIAEDLPKEFLIEKDDILHVDLYALMGVMVNAMKDLNEKVKKLEDK